MSNVEPFPVRGAKRYIEKMRSLVALEPMPQRRRTVVRAILEQHERQLISYGCSEDSIARDVAELRTLITSLRGQFADADERRHDRLTNRATRIAQGRMTLDVADYGSSHPPTATAGYIQTI